MKVALLNSVDRRGGAARAAHRLHCALRSSGIDSRLLVQTKLGDEESVLGPDGALGILLGTLRPAADLLPVVGYRRRTGATFYPGWLPDRTVNRAMRFAPDVLHLHWITGGFVNVRSLRKFGGPLVWTLHDMWAFTGGCHYDDGCGRYLRRCGECPVLGSSAGLDLSRLGWRRKRRAYRGLDLHVVTPSRWLGDAARASPLLEGIPVSVIPNPIDTARFRPIDKTLARTLLDLPQDRRLVLFGALRSTSEPRKGFGVLQPALKRLAGGQRDGLTAVIFGASRPAAVPDFGMPGIFVGTLSDDLTLALLYSAADVYVAPSTQENLSNTVMESLACGTPAVAFDIGGMPDMIEHQRNGFLARPFDEEDLARGIGWILEDDNRRRTLSERARTKVLEEFEASNIARRYVELYERAIAGIREE